MGIFFIADTHFDDRWIKDYYHRPFGSAAEMNEALIDNWNSTVGDDDEIFHLGDFGDPEYLPRLKGHIRLICGNHDSYDSLRSGPYARYIDFLSPYPVMAYGCLLSHQPIDYIPAECPYLNIHGHTHSLSYGLKGSAGWAEGNRYFCVSVEQIGYRPVSFEEIAKQIGY